MARLWVARPPLWVGVILLATFTPTQSRGRATPFFGLRVHSVTSFSPLMLAFTLAWTQSMFIEMTVPKAFAWFSK